MSGRFWADVPYVLTCIFGFVGVVIVGYLVNSWVDREKDGS